MAQIVQAIRKGADVHDVHVDVPLSNIAVAYMQSDTEFIADKVFPIVPVAKMSDKYPTYKKETFFRNRAKPWRPGTPMAQAGFDVEWPTYSCDFKGFEYPLGWDIKANADDQLQFDRTVTEFVTRVMLLGREVDWATKYFTTGVWGTDMTGVASNPTDNQFVQWSDYANSDPIGDFRKARLLIHKNTGFQPNTAVMSQEVFEVLADHLAIKDIYKYTQSGVLTTDLVARALRVDKLVVAGAVQITSPDGVASESYDWIYGKRAWLGYVAPRPSILMPSAGYIFGWRGMTKGYDVAIERHVESRAHADFIQGITCYDMKKVGADLGVLFDAAVA